MAKLARLGNQEEKKLLQPAVYNELPCESIGVSPHLILSPGFSIYFWHPDKIV